VRASFVFFVAVAAAGCLRLDVPNGALKCSSDPNRRCPVGYYCAPDNACWKNDSPFAGRSRQLGGSCVRDGDCDSGHCADGVCCDSACSGTCQACNIAGGNCTTVAGKPPGFKSCPVAVFDNCAASCDGVAPDCTFPGASKPCGAQACFGPPAMLKAATFCDGAGNCAPLDGGMLTMPCPTPPHATATCAGDQCDFTCTAPYQRQGAGCVPGDM